MDKFHTMALFFLQFFFLLLVENVYTISICDQTPYPDLCNSVAKLDKLPFNVRDASLRFTLAEAQKLHTLISTTMKSSSFNQLAKSAWADCLELSQDTIDKVNRCIAHQNVPSSKADAQTWLSAAIANQETCQNGFIDFKLPFELSLPFPFLLGNFSKQLSNSLAIIKATPLPPSSTSSLRHKQFAKQMKSRNLLGTHGAHWTRTGDQRFPEWVSMADRRLLQTPGASSNADIVIAKDGSGDFTTINEALKASSSRKGTNRFVIYVKKGVYQENVVITKSMKNFMFIGDGIDSTIVTGSKNVQDGTTTFRSATFAVSGNGFIARGITFENAAGPQKHQAVALRSGSDFSVFYSCSFKGYQDTLYVYSQRQFYRDCDIYGTVDFIFGDGIVVFQNCNIYIRKPLSNQVNTVTAQSRKDANENTGIIIHNSRIIGSADLGSTKSYLGRPWKQYSRTVIMRTLIDGSIDPAGWLPWDGNFALETLYYGEYMNLGAGARTSGRVKWPGYHVITSSSEAEKFSVGEFLGGDSWIPGTRVPFTSGL